MASAPDNGAIDVVAELEEGVKDFAKSAGSFLGVLSTEDQEEELVARKFSVPYVVRAGGALLTVCAGIINVASFLHLGAFTSHTTGTLAKVGMGLQLDDGRFNPGALILLIVSFVAGSLMCGLFIGKNKLHFGLALYDFGLLSVSLLTILTFVTAETDAAKYLSAAACGLQNGLCTEWGGASIRTTHVTGLFTDVGLLIGRMISMLARKGCGTRFDVIDRGLFADDRSKLAVLAILGVSYLLGAFLGTVLYNSLQEKSFLVPAAVTGTMGLAYLFYRVRILHQKLFSTEEMEVIDVHADLAADFQQETKKSPTSTPITGKTDNKGALERCVKAHCENAVVVVSKADMLKKINSRKAVDSGNSSNSVGTEASRRNVPQAPDQSSPQSDAIPPSRAGFSL